jgi:hypothetical protein
MSMLGIFGIGLVELLIVAVMLLAPLVLVGVLVVVGLRRRDSVGAAPCPGCNRSIPPYSESCPHCGRALR